MPIWELYVHPDGDIVWRDPENPWNPVRASPWRSYGLFEVGSPQIRLRSSDRSRLPLGAVLAEPAFQTFGWGGPHLLYLDRLGRCRACHSDFTFTAAEQRRWYEAHGLWNEIVPTRCAPCRDDVRRSKAAQKRLQDAHTALEELGPSGDRCRELAEAVLAASDQVGLPAIERGIAAAREAGRRGVRQAGDLEEALATLGRR